jgi:ATP-dependent DNA helicase RecQ
VADLHQADGPRPIGDDERERASERARVRSAARRLLGFDELRPGQEEAAAALLEGRDVLAVLPTGAGKSAIYQVAGALLPGPTVVVSPLIALQHDQVTRIGDSLGGAAQVNSSVSDGQRRAVLADAEAGDIEFVFVAPEQLANEETLGALRAGAPSLVVVDEAHCISTWGHDFRPDDRRLATFVDELGRPPLLALTATAAPPVRADIVEQLRLTDPVVVVAGFERPNIRLDVVSVEDQQEAQDRIIEVVDSTDGTGIVYVATRQQTEDLAERLDRPHRPGLAYHAGLSSRDRAMVHERFQDDAPSVVVATTAFGMGIDVPHVRFVVHAEVPESLDAYLQELGRAGRDGEPARAVLVSARTGGGGRQFFSGIGEIPAVEVADVAEAVASSTEPLPVEVLASVSDLSDSRLQQVLGLLEEVEAVEVEDDAVRWRTDQPVDDTAEAAAAVRDAERSVERTRRQMVARYVETDGCRWQALLAYFGEPRHDPCGRCDRCDAGVSAPVAGADHPYPLEARVRHRDFGDGLVVEQDDRSVTVLFDEAGYRTLDVALAVDKGLLTRLDPS